MNLIIFLQCPKKLIISRPNNAKPQNLSENWSKALLNSLRRPLKWGMIEVSKINNTGATIKIM